MLAIIKFIEENGLAKAIEKFKLKTKVYENKILLKYDQIESDRIRYVMSRSTRMSWPYS